MCLSVAGSRPPGRGLPGAACGPAVSGRLSGRCQAREGRAAWGNGRAWGAGEEGTGRAAGSGAPGGGGGLPWARLGAPRGGSCSRPRSVEWLARRCLSVRRIENESRGGVLGAGGGDVCVCEGSGAEIDRVKPSVALKALYFPFSILETSCWLASEVIHQCSAKIRGFRSTRSVWISSCCALFLLCALLLAVRSSCRFQFKKTK